MDRTDCFCHDLIRNIINENLSSDELLVVRKTLAGSLDVFIEQARIWEDIENNGGKKIL